MLEKRKFLIVTAKKAKKKINNKTNQNIGFLNDFRYYCNLDLFLHLKRFLIFLVLYRIYFQGLLLFIPDLLNALFLPHPISHGSDFPCT